MDQIALGKRIKAAREAAGLTQEELAAAVDYSVDHMSVIERGVKSPKLEKLVAIANVLHIGADELLQDALDTATVIQASELSRKLGTLSLELQRKVMNIDIADELSIVSVAPVFAGVLPRHRPLDLHAVSQLVEHDVPEVFIVFKNKCQVAERVFQHKGAGFVFELLFPGIVTIGEILTGVSLSLFKEEHFHTFVLRCEFGHLFPQSFL